MNNTNCFNLLLNQLQNQQAQSFTIQVKGQGDNGLFVVSSAEKNSPSDFQNFSSPSFQLFQKILESGKINADQCCLLQILWNDKKDFAPLEDQYLCQNWIEAFTVALQPQVILTAGSGALSFFTFGSLGIQKMQGLWQRWKNIAVMPLYDPAYLLQNDDRTSDGPKFHTWQAILKVGQRLKEMK